MATKVHYIAEGFHTLTPHLVITGAAKAMDWYKKALGATEISRMPAPDGTRIMHGEMKLGNSMFMLADEFPEMDPESKSPQKLGGAGVGLFIYVPDVDAVYNQAVAAGATPRMPPMDMFWGDRYSKITDPFGHHWSIATHKEDVSPEEMKKRAAAAFQNQ
jgi:uncharacterized glyoxalase superfamily protein PhnB